MNQYVTAIIGENEGKFATIAEFARDLHSRIEYQATVAAIELGFSMIVLVAFVVSGIALVWFIISYVWNQHLENEQSKNQGTIYAWTRARLERARFYSLISVGFVVIFGLIALFVQNLTDKDVADLAGVSKALKYAVNDYPLDKVPLDYLTVEDQNLEKYLRSLVP